jgi:hypothetical protein
MFGRLGYPRANQLVSYLLTFLLERTRRNPHHNGLPHSRRPRVHLQSNSPLCSPTQVYNTKARQKYTVSSVGIWEKIRRVFALVPERSSGIPLNPTYRNPSPASVPATAYTDPVTIPAADIAENPYWKRDVRRNYARTAVFRQSDVAGLLTLGSVANPRIGKGEEGAKQLVSVKSAEGQLADVLQDKSLAKAVLGEGGLPPVPLPGRRKLWTQDVEGSYPPGYPCRSFA